MDSSQAVSFRLAAPGKFVAETKANRYWIAASLLGLMLWTVASAALFQWAEPDNKRTQGNYGNCLYFTVINVTTVGFGDMTPDAPAGKLIAACNALFGVIWLGLIVAIFAAAFQAESGSVEFPNGLTLQRPGQSPQAGTDQTGPACRLSSVIRSFADEVERMDARLTDLGVDVIIDKHVEPSDGPCHVHILIRMGCGSSETTGVHHLTTRR